jgi:uncharacterized membrane protein
MQTSKNYRLGYPLQRIFVPFPFVSFTLALATDIAYWQTVNLMWQNFSSWLLFAGLLFGALAILAAIIDLIRPSTRSLHSSVPAVFGFVTVLVLAFINSLVHAGDGWTAVVPVGLGLSLATVAAILLTLILAARTDQTLNWSTP